MTSVLEPIYLGHDNTINLQLTADSVAVDTSGFTKVTATLESEAGVKLTVTTLAAAKATGSIKWDQSGYDTGEIRIKFGDQSLTGGQRHTLKVVAYDSTNTDGVVWGDGIQVLTWAEVES